MSTPLLIADGDIPTTDIIARVIREAFGAVEIVFPAALQGAKLRDRVAIISRLCLPELAWLPDHLNQQAIGYSYFLDDNLFELDVTYDRHIGAFFSHPATRNALSQFVVGAERVIVMSSLLAEDLQRRFPNLQLHLITAPIDLVLIDSIHPPHGVAASEKFRVGYPSTRRPNVSELLVNVVTRSLARHGDAIEFEFMGWMPDGLMNLRGVNFLPAVDGYENYVSAVKSRGWDIALAPLMNSRFENCKTNLKYREYGAFGIPGVYSAVPLYAASIESGRTGLLAQNNAEDWLRCLDLLFDDVVLRETIARAARDDVEKRHAQSLAATQLRLMFDEFAICAQ